jgi:hypothetical protein
MMKAYNNTLTETHRVTRRSPRHEKDGAGGSVLKAACQRVALRPTGNFIIGGLLAEVSLPIAVHFAHRGVTGDKE